MVNRLKHAIPNLIDPDQTGFVHGRSIAENFVYAADLLSCCHKQNKPTAVLKLDFKKAFDSVSWDSLIQILYARGFDDRWCSQGDSGLRSKPKPHQTTYIKYDNIIQSKPPHSI